MRNKIGTIAVLVAVMLLLSACTVMIPQKTAEEVVEEEEIEEIIATPNPVVAVENADALAKFGYPLSAPVNATDVRYSIVDSKLAQVEFVYEGLAYRYRAANLSEKDIHGIQGGFDTPTHNFALSTPGYNIGGTIQTAGGGAYGALASWRLADAQFTLSTDDVTNRDAIAALACELAIETYADYQKGAEEIAVAPEITAMLPVLNTIGREVGANPDVAWLSTDEETYWNILCAMAVNYGLDDERVAMSGGRIGVPRDVMFEWAEALFADSIGLMTLPKDLKPLVYYYIEDDLYRVALSAKGEGETRIERVYTRTWTNEIYLTLGVYANNGDRLGGFSAVIVPNLAPTAGTHFLYSVKSVSPEGPPA